MARTAYPLPDQGSPTLDDAALARSIQVATKAHADAASASATTASGAATTATTQAGLASASAVTAAGHVTTALGHAAAADASADAAAAQAVIATTQASNAATSADLAAEWAEGTLPGGAGTKSAKEHAEDAEAALSGVVADVAAFSWPMTAAKAGAVTGTGADQRALLQAGLDAKDQILLTDASAAYRVDRPVQVRSQQVFDGAAGVLHNPVNSADTRVTTALQVGHAHPENVHGNWFTGSQVGGLTWTPVVGFSGAVIEMADAAQALAVAAAGHTALLRGTGFSSTTTGSVTQRLYREFDASQVTAINDKYITLAEPVAREFAGLTVSIADANQGIAGDNGEAFYIGHDQRLSGVRLSSAYGTGWSRGGMIDGLILGGTCTGLTGWMQNLVNRTQVIGWKGVGTQRAFEAAMNSRDLTFVGGYFGLVNAGAWLFADPARFAESCRNVVLLNPMFALDAFDKADGNGLVFGPGAKGCGLVRGEISAASVALNVTKWESSAGHVTEGNMLIGVRQTAGQPDRFAYYHPNGGTLRDNGRAFVMTTSASDPDLVAVELDGTGNFECFNGNPGGKLKLLASAARCVAVGSYYADGFDATMTDAIRAANVVALNYSDGVIANNIVSAGMEKYAQTVPADTLVGAPMVLASGTFAAGNVATGLVFSICAFGQAAVTSAAVRTISVQYYNTSTAAWVDLATVTTNAAVQDWLVEGTIEIETNVILISRFTQSVPGGTTPNTQRIASQNFSANGLQVRIIGYMDGPTATNTVYRTYCRPKQPGMVGARD